YRELAIVMQCGWGGVYMDNDVAAAELAGRWRQIEALLERPSDGNGRLVVVFSDFRGISARGRVARPAVDTGGRHFLRAYAGEADPFVGAPCRVGAPCVLPVPATVELPQGDEGQMTLPLPIQAYPVEVYEYGHLVICNAGRQGAAGNALAHAVVRHGNG